MVVEIPHLPPDLRIVPSPAPGEGKSHEWRVAYLDWHGRVRHHRIKRRMEADADPRQQEIEIARCMDDPNYEITMYGFIEEPRTHSGAGKGILPFIQMPYQIQDIHWYRERINDPDHPNAYEPKSRELGVTLNVIGFLLNRWKWESPFTSMVMSYEETLVDKTADKSRSLFAKLMYQLSRHPVWLRPNFTKAHMALVNEDNGNVIDGWTTTKRPARGARYTVGFVDEGAQVRNLGNVLASISGAADTFIITSTSTNEVSTEWEDLITAVEANSPEDPKRPGHKLTVMRRHYYENVYLTEEVMERKRQGYAERNDMARFMAEYLMEPYGDEAGYVYPIARKRPVVPGLGYRPDLITCLNIDGGGYDFTAITVCQLDYERPDLPPDAILPQVNWIDSFVLNGVPAETYGHVITGIPPEPGDEAYGLLDPDDPFLALMRQLPHHDPFLVRMYSDPTLNNKEMATRQSFINKLTVKMEELYLREHGKVWKPRVTYSWGEKFTHHHRQLATHNVLVHSFFAANPGALRILDGFKRYRLSNTKQARTSEAKPMHERMFSDIVTSAEFGCVGIDGNVYAGHKRAAPKVYDFAGRVVA